MALDNGTIDRVVDKLQSQTGPLTLDESLRDLLIDALLYAERHGTWPAMEVFGPQIAEGLERA